ncbi:hypothetical protein LCGC14_2073730 [marine sediment metagenome]|uniref:DUF177 domain-containing protein n=1 Tax=marine sediment metagenome TaxID=412755 RepID=A0A0F9F4Y4_9ZZZZ
MKIKVDDIPEEGLEIKTVEKVTIADDLNADVELDLNLRRLAGEVFISGGAETSLPLECSRCLKGFLRKLELRLDLAYSRDSGDLVEGHEVTAEEVDAGTFAGEELDIGEIVAEQLVLSVPMKPLCSEGCKGICPKCGADLNEKGCGCETGSIDPRFQVLKEYLKKKEQDKNGEPN